MTPLDLIADATAWETRTRRRARRDSVAYAAMAIVFGALAWRISGPPLRMGAVLTALGALWVALQTHHARLPEAPRGLAPLKQYRHQLEAAIDLKARGRYPMVLPLMVGPVVMALGLIVTTFLTSPVLLFPILATLVILGGLAALFRALLRTQDHLLAELHGRLGTLDDIVEQPLSAAPAQSE